MDLPAALAAARDLRTRVLAPLSERFAGRGELVELLGLALAAGENLLVVGPPGTAKSGLVAELASRLRGKRFEYLLTRFTEPSEIFGPVDLAALRQGRYLTRSEGMLPEAEVVFLDEVFNAGSSILNTLLGILNEGVFRRGSEVLKTRILAVLAATNAIPREPSLRALLDRFSLRVEVAPLDDEGLPLLLARGWALEEERLQGAAEGSPAANAEDPAADPAALRTDAVRGIQRALADVDVRPIQRRVVDLVKRLRALGMFISDRRAVKLQRLAAASALLSGRSFVVAADLWPFRYVWEEPQDREALEEVFNRAVEEWQEVGHGGPEDGRHDNRGQAAAAFHPLAGRAVEPQELLRRLQALEDAVHGLSEPPAGLLVDEIHNRIQDLDSRRRWCRPRSPQEAHDLRVLSTRLVSLAGLLEQKQGL